MKTRIKVEAQAWLDLGEIADFIAEFARTRRSIIDLVDQFERKAEAYARQPEMGDLREDLGDNLRSFRFHRWYVAVYQPLSDGIDVLRIFDGRSDYGRHFDK